MAERPTELGDFKGMGQFELNARPVTHPSTNQAQHRVTSLIETKTNALPLSQTATSYRDSFYKTQQLWDKCKLHSKTGIHRHQTPPQLRT